MNHKNFEMLKVQVNGHLPKRGANRRSTQRKPLDSQLENRHQIIITAENPPPPSLKLADKFAWSEHGGSNNNNNEL